MQVAFYGIMALLCLLKFLFKKMFVSRWVCDGSPLGCFDGSDEENCEGCADGLLRCGDKTLCKTRGQHLPCDGECLQGYQKCYEHLCVTHRQSCNGTCLR